MLRLVVAPCILHVRLVESVAVDVDVAVPLYPAITGNTDDPLDVHTAAARAEQLRSARRIEDDDLLSFRIAEVVDEPVRENAVRRSRLAPTLRSRAVQRRLHRRGRNAVGVDDPRLHREHDRDRDGERQDPVDDRPPAAREIREEPLERAAQRRSYATAGASSRPINATASRSAWTRCWSITRSYPIDSISRSRSITWSTVPAGPRSP